MESRQLSAASLGILANSGGVATIIARSQSERIRSAAPIQPAVAFLQPDSKNSRERRKSGTEQIHMS
jgi:hypothetical protein